MNYFLQQCILAFSSINQSVVCDSLESVHDGQCGKNDEVEFQSQLPNNLGVHRLDVAHVCDTAIGGRLDAHPLVVANLF